MKTTFLKIVIGLLLALNTGLISAQAWVSVGEMNITPNYIPVLAMDSNDVPYVFYQDNLNNQKGFVKRFQNNTWELLGEEGVEILGDIGAYALAIDNNDIPYIAYVNTDGKAVVKKFENNQWQTIGGDVVSNETTQAISLAFDNNNIPHISYFLYNGSSTIVLQKFESGSWQTVGEEIDFQSAQETRLIFDSNNIPYVAYIISTGFLGPRYLWVKKFDNSSWQNVGPYILLSPSDFSSIDFVLDSQNTPYIAYNHSDHVVVARKFEAGEWQELKVVSGSYTFLGAFTIDSDDNLYLSTSIYSESQMQIQKFENDSWQDIGEIDEVYVGTYELALDSNNMPYCLFYVANGGSYSASVMKFDPTASVETSVFNKVEMYPNPASQSVTLTNLAENTAIKITDLTGKLIYSTKAVGASLTIDTTGFTSGLYLVELMGYEGNVVKKLVIK